MKTLRWILWAIRGLWPLSDEKYKAWIAATPGHESTPPEVVEQIEGQPRTPDEWKGYNHRFTALRGGMGGCAKCGMNEAFPIHWIAQALADHVKRGGSPADFKMPSHPFWRRSSINACGMCGREENHVYHEGVPIDSTVHSSASPGSDLRATGSGFDREGL